MIGAVMMHAEYSPEVSPRNSMALMAMLVVSCASIVYALYCLLTVGEACLSGGTSAANCTDIAFTKVLVWASLMQLVAVSPMSLAIGTYAVLMACRLAEQRIWTMIACQAVTCLLFFSVLVVWRLCETIATTL